MIFIILALSLVLRLISINQSLWLDEAIYVLAIQHVSLWNLVTKFLVGDFHPPLYISILWVWDRIFGYSEIASRLPSVIFGVAAVWLTYYLGKNLFNKKIGLLAGLFLALSPLDVYYSQEARMYSMSVFLATVSFIFLWRLINNQKWGMVGFIISTVLILYTDYPLALLIPTQVLFCLIFERKSFRKIILSLIIAGVIFLPWLVIFQKQLISGQAVAAALPNWASIVGGSSLKELALIPIKTIFGRISFDNKYLYALLSGIAGILYLGVLVNVVKKLDKKIWLLIFWTIIPVILAFLISFFVPVLSYFRMIYILPGLFLLLAKGVDNLPKKMFWPALVGILLISAVSLLIYYTNPKFQREDWREAVSKTAIRGGGNSMYVFESNTLYAPYIYYSNLIYFSRPGLKKVPANSDQDLVNLNYQGTSDIYLFEYLVDINDPKRLLEKKIKNSDYIEIETLNFNGVGLVHHYQYRY